MANVPTGTAQYLTRFGEQTIAGNPYALAKLGIEKAHCSLKIEKYLILCIPFQLGFKRSIFMASLSTQELAFFQKYLNATVGLSLALNPNKRPEPVKFFLRCTLTTIGQMKGRDNTGLFVLDYKSSPDQMISMLGSFMETQERLRTQYEDYGKTPVKITPDAAKMMGYNMYATAAEPAADTPPRRIQIFSLNTKSMGYIETAGAPVLPAGTPVAYQLFFKKFRITVNGVISACGPLPQGLIRSTANLEFSPELVEIMDEYWYSSGANSPQKPIR